MIAANKTRWFILALLFVARVGLGFQFQTIGSVSAVLVEDLGFSYTQIGSLIGLFMVPGLILSIPAGFAGRFMSDRFIVGLGLLTLAAGGGIAAIADGFEFLAFGRIVCGIGFAVSTIFLTKLVADWFAGKELATAMAILVMSWPFGIAMGQIGHGWLAANFGWPLAFIVASLYCLVGGLLVMVLCREAPGAATSPRELKFVLSRNEVIQTVIASLAWAAFNAGYVVYLSFAPRVLVAGGYDMVPALGVISLASWVMIISGAVCGYIADRTGKADLILYICIAMAVLALSLLSVISMAIPSSLLFGLMGAAPAGLIMALMVYATKPENRALGMGLFFSSYFLFQAPAPAIAGWLYDHSNNAYWPILFAIALFICTAFANLGFRRAQKRFPI